MWNGEKTLEQKLTDEYSYCSCSVAKEAAHRFKVLRNIMNKILKKSKNITITKLKIMV